MDLNLPLTRRRDPDYEAWLSFYGDLHVARSACDLALRLLVPFQPNLIAVSCTALSIRSVAIRFLLTPCQSRMRPGYERPLCAKSCHSLLSNFARTARPIPILSREQQARQDAFSEDA